MENRNRWAECLTAQQIALLHKNISFHIIPPLPQNISSQIIPQKPPLTSSKCSPENRTQRMSVLPRETRRHGNMPGTPPPLKYQRAVGIVLIYQQVHMQKAHSFAIPYVQHCEDCEGAARAATRAIISRAIIFHFPEFFSPGLLNYLSEKIAIGGMCIQVPFPLLHTPCITASLSFLLSPASSPSYSPPPLSPSYSPPLTPVQPRLWLSRCRPRPHAGQEPCDFRRGDVC